MLDRKKTPPILDAINFTLKLKPYQKMVLKNGVEVYAVDAGGEEVMSLEWVFFAGNCFEEQNLVAATANFLLRNGTSKKTAFQIKDHLEFFGSYLNRAWYNETAAITLHCLTKHVAELLPVVKELITDSTMPQDELEIYKQNMKQRLKVSLKKSDFVAGRMIDAYLYGKKHPYGKYSSAEDFDALNREQLLEFYKKYYQHGKLILLVAGKLPANLEQLLNQHFGDMPGKPLATKQAVTEPAEEKKFRITNDAEGVQGSIRIARPFPN